MNMKKILAAATASVLSVSAFAVVASADPALKVTVTEDGAPTGNVWELNFADHSDVDFSKVDKVVATVTCNTYCNGGMGGNVFETGWLSGGNGQVSDDKAKAGGTEKWTWDGIGGLTSGPGEDGNETGYFKAEVWWVCVTEDGEDGVATIDSVEFFDNAGTLLFSVGDVDAGAGDPEDEPTEDEPTEDEPTEDEPTEDEPTEDEPTDEKPNPDSGIEGVAAVLGVAVVAAGAMVVAKKRK